MGVASPMMIGSLKLGSTGLPSGIELAAERWKGLRSSKKIGNGVIGRQSAGKKIDGPKAKVERLNVDHGRKARRLRGRRIRCDAESRGGGGGGGFNGVVQEMSKLLACEKKDLANQAAIDLVSSLDQEGRAALLSALYRRGLDEDLDEHFREADTNLDGIIDQKEFATYAEAQAIKYGNSSSPLTTQQKVHLFTKAAIGMVGFGFTDNAIMIIAGDVIQNSIGATLGLTTLLSAGLGNAVADLIGTAFRGYIERWSGKLMRQDVAVSARQMQQKEAWWAETMGASFGVTVGCLLGLTPLILLQRKDDQQSSDARTIDSTKFASISSSTTASSSLSSPSRVVAGDDDLEYGEHSTRVTSLSTCVQPAVTPPQQLRSFHSKLLGTPLLLYIVVLMASRRVVNYMKAFGFKNRNQFCE